MADAGGKFWKVTPELGGRTDLTWTAKGVYAYLLDRQGGNGECWPGQRRIARDCGISLKAANRAVGELAEVRLIVVASAGGFSGERQNRSAHYRVNVIESTTLAKGERSPSDRVNVSESRTATLSNRVHNQTHGTRPNGTRSKGRLEEKISVKVLNG